VLEPLDSVGHQHSEEAEREQRERVYGPGLLGIRFHAAQAVQPPLHRPKTRGSGCRSPSEDAEHVRPERLGQRQHHHEEQGDLQPSIGSHQKRSG